MNEMAEQETSVNSPSGRRAGMGKMGVIKIALVAIVLIALGLAFQHGRPHADNPQTRTMSPAEIEQQAHDHPDDFRAQLRWGETLFQAKRLEEAGNVLDHARQLDPKDARPYAWLGVVALSERRTDQARALIHEALQRDPANTTAIRALANADAQARHLRPAIQGFERLVQLRPNDADAWQRLGLLLMGAGENYRSLDALSRSAALDPTDLLTQRALGNMALQAGRLDQAAQAFHAVLARDPDDPEGLLGLAKTTMRRDPSPAGLTSAEQEADAALRARPSPEAYSARGQIRMTQRRLPEAIQDFEACIKLDPQSWEAYVLLSQCYASAGRPDMARKISADFERLRAERLARDRAAGRAPKAAR